MLVLCKPVVSVVAPKAHVARQMRSSAGSSAIPRGAKVLGARRARRETGRSKSNVKCALRRVCRTVLPHWQCSQSLPWLQWQPQLHVPHWGTGMRCAHMIMFHTATATRLR
jgi:hypothetical protein